MTGAMESDIESFISQQKKKLAQEREGFEHESPRHERKTWDKPAQSNQPAFAEEVPRAQTPQQTGLLIGRNSYETRRKKLQEDRRREYNDLLAKKSPSKGSGARGPRVSFKGGYDSISPPQQQAPEEIPNRNFPVSRKENLPPPKPQTPDTFLNKLGRHEQQKKKLNEERKQEYNRLLADKSRRGDGALTRRGGGVEEASPLLKPRSSEQTSSGNEAIPPAAPRAGWVTPTYEEILQKKKQEEQQYRQYNDPEFSHYNPSLSGNRGNAYSHGSLENEANAFRSAAPQGTLGNAYRPQTQVNPQPQIQPQVQGPSSPRRQLPEQTEKPLATLMIGREESNSAKHRRQAAYRNDLQQQMQEKLESKKWEKMNDSRINATGATDPEKSPERLKPLPKSDALNPPPLHDRNLTQKPPVYNGPIAGPSGLSSGQLTTPSTGPLSRPLFPPETLTPAQRDYPLSGNYINPYLNALDSLSLQTNALLEGQRNLGYGVGGAGGSGPGILNRGWEELLARPKPQIPPAVPPAYQNSYLSGIPDYGAVNEAYYRSGMSNPLDSYNQIPDATQIQHNSAPSTNLRLDEPSPPKAVENHYVVKPFPDEEPVSRKTKQKQDTQSYQAELQKQIEEQKLKKKREKEEQERQDRKWEEENKNYNPFGRGGGGAPLKDAAGQTLADLRQLKLLEPDGQAVKQSPRGPQQPLSARLVANSPPPNPGEETFARGGHGIFGVPKTEEEKSASDKYKDDLRLQIEDKRRREAEERERLKFEEEKENRRLQEQQQKIQEEFELEQRKKQEKEEEARRKNEELRLLTEEKKRQAEEEKKKLEEKRMQELKEKQDEEARDRQRQQHQNDQRGNSPVVPALRKKNVSSPRKAPTPQNNQEESLPPRANSADVLNQLAAMRRQLQSEQARVQNALERQKQDYEVYDPRLVVQRPPVIPRRESELDVFEEARNRAPVSVRRPPPPDHASTSNLREFNNLKHKDTESRRGIRQNYPDSPTSNGDLERQQLAMIHQQEESLRRQRNGELPDLSPGLRDPLTPQALLQSDSAFIDFNGVSDIPDDLEDLPRRNDNARQRRREKASYSPRFNEDNFSLNSNPMGSQTSLNVDRISKKNEERLKRLKQMVGDDGSLADPDDVLERFMARQKHNRPPSGQTLQDDTWMRPGSK